MSSWNKYQWRCQQQQKVIKSIQNHQHIQSQNIYSGSRFFKAFALSHTLAPTSGTISPKTSGYSLFLQKPTQDIFLLRIFQLSHIVLHPYQSVRACVCVYVCAWIFCLVMLEPLLMSTLCVSFFFLTADNIFHLNALYVCYTMRVQRFEPQERRFTNFHYYYNYYKHSERTS